MSFVDVGDAVTATGTALGVLEPAGTSHRLVGDFFASPGRHIGKILSNPVQRAALLDAMALLLPADTPAGTTRYLLVEEAPVRVFLTVTATGSGAAAVVVLGLAAEAVDEADGVDASLDLPLVRAEQSSVGPLIGTPDGPVGLEVAVAVGTGGARVVLGARIVAPPHAAQSRVVLRIEGLAGSSPIEFEPTAGGAAIGPLVTTLVGLVLEVVGPAVPPEVRLVAQHLPGLLGLSEGLPPLPLFPGTTSVRGWLRDLVGADGGNAGDAIALWTWLGHVAALLGAPPLTPRTAAPTEADPAVIELRAPDAAGPGLVVTVAVRAATPTAAPQLVVGVRTALEGGAIDAAVVGEATLLALPLDGTGPPRLLEALRLLIEAPAGTGPLFPPAGTADPDLVVGRVRAGLSYRDGTLDPVLELLDVRLRVAPGSATVDHERIDLTDIDAIAAAAAGTVADAVTAGLGTGAVADALLTLVGLDRPAGAPTVDPVRLATAPVAALLDYYRALLASPDGWVDVLRAVWLLLGGDPGAGGLASVPIDGTGTESDPWRVGLDHLGFPAATPVRLKALLWDAATTGSGAPRLRLGLLVGATVAGSAITPAWDVEWQIELFGIDFGAGATPTLRMAGDMRAVVRASGIPTLPASAGIAVQLDGVELALSWTPGRPLAASVSLTNVGVHAEGVTVVLGDLAVPGVDLDAADLGLGRGGADPAAVWAAVRLLTARLAIQHAGPAGGLVAALLGAGAPGISSLPPLAPPDSGDLRELLGDPLAAIARWLVALVGEDGLDGDGRPYVVAALGALQALLTDRVGHSVDDEPLPSLPVGGAGTPETPWAVPIQPPGGTPFELLVWCEPEGPPGGWPRGVLTAVAAAEVGGSGDSDATTAPTAADDAPAGPAPGDEPPPDGAALVDLAARLTEVGAVTTAALGGLDPTVVAGFVDDLAVCFAGSDGLVETTAARPDEWPSVTLPATHWGLPADPTAVAAVAAQVEALTDGLSDGEWALLVVDAGLAPPGSWAALTAATGHGPATSVSLRMAGVDPALVDLGSVGAADAYVIDPADDGGATLDAVATRIARVAARVRTARATPTRFVVVAHSHAGLPALAYARDHAADVLGVVTLGTPLVTGTPVAADPVLAEAARATAALVPGTLPGVIGEALAGLTATLDSIGVPEPARPPVPSTFPAAAFARAGDDPPDAGGVPVLAVVGEVPGDLRRAVRAGLLASATTDARDPTALAYGIRVALALPATADGDPDIDVTLRVNLGGLAFVPGAAPTPAVELRVSVSAPDGWILGGAGDGEPLHARVRAADLVARVGGTIGFEVVLHDSALDGIGGRRVTLDDPSGPPLLDALVRDWASRAPAGGRLAAITDLLVDIGLVGRDTAGPAVRTDAVAALAARPAAYLAPRLPALLDRAAGLLGLHKAPGTATATGPWRYQHPDLPFEVVSETDPARLTVRTTGAGLPVGPVARLRTTSVVTFAAGGPQAQSDATIAIGATTLEASTGGPRVTLTGPGLDGPLVLVPADPAVVRDRALGALPVLVAGTVIHAAFEALAGVPLAPLDPLLRNPGRWLAGLVGTAGQAPDPAKLNALLAAVAAAAGLPTQAATPLSLPGGLAVRADTAGTATRLRVWTPTPLDVGDPADPIAIEVSAAIDVDADRQVTPAGSFTTRVPLPGQWGGLAVAVAVDATGPTVAVTPEALGTPITLFPSLSGLGALAGAAAERLLPSVLDQLTTGLGGAGAHVGLDAALAVAAAVGIYDPATARFDGDALASLADDLRAGNLPGTASQQADAIAAVLRALADPTVVSHTAGGSTVGVSLPAVLSGTLSLDADLARSPPGLTFEATGVELGAVTADVELRSPAPSASARVALQASFDTGRGLALTPSIEASIGTGGVEVALRPFGDDSIVIPIVPTPTPPTPAQLGVLATGLGIPAAARLTLEVLDPQPPPAGTPLFAREVWTGGPTVGDLAKATALVEDDPGGSGVVVVAGQLPSPSDVARGLAAALSGQTVALGTSGLELGIATEQDWVGLALSGEAVIPTGDYTVAIGLGPPGAGDPGWGAGASGLTVFLATLPTGGEPRLEPRLRLGGVGLRVGKDDGTPLVDTRYFRLDGVGAYALVDLPFTSATPLRPDGPVYGAVLLEGLGLPIGTGGNDANPVAASLLQSRGPGDQAPANPPVDLLVGSTAAGWVVRFGDQDALRIPIHKSFGPLSIDELAFAFRAGPPPDRGAVGVGITGAVAVGPLAVGVQDLSVTVPLATPSDLRTWGLDLAGLAVRLVTPAVSIAGGLLRVKLPDGSTEYDGALSVSLAGRTITAIGAYAQPTDVLGRYTSLFVFVSFPFPLGGPPYFFVMGIAGGAGYNRRLLVPSDPTAIPAFPLVAALSGGLGSGDPMDALREMSTDIPARRGSFWVAGGLRWTTFSLLQGTALAYVALDRGLELGLLGLLQLQLPPASDAAVLSVELALAAKFSTADMVLSVRAALTKNSWLISKDCQLTGGFAFVAWFRRPEVVLTIGGYADDFSRPDYYPVVDRVGLRWAVSDGIVVKGGSYFALTHSALMLGGSLTVTAQFGPLRAWLTAGLAVTVRWDPFSYDVTSWITIGVALHLEVCFIGCVTKDFGAELGASLHIQGPPLHGTVRASFMGFSIPVEFGRSEPQPFLSWDEVRVKYLGGGDAARPATTTTIATGMREVTGPPAKGGEADPWPVAATVTLKIESAMPARAWRLGGSTGGDRQSPFAVPAAVDVVPAKPSFGKVHATLVARVERKDGTAWRALPAATLDTATVDAIPASFPAAVWDASAGSNPTAPMLSALGGLALSFPVVEVEATGRFGDANAVPFASMIEEEMPIALPLSGGPPQSPRPAPPARAPRAASAAGLDTTSPPVTPRSAVRRRAVLPPARHDVSGPRAGRRVGLAARPFPTPAPGPTTELAAGAAALWDLDPGAPFRLRGRGRALVRVTAFTGAGAPLADTVVPAEGLGRVGASLPRDATRVVVTAVGVAGGDGAPSGWQSHTTLLQVGPATLLAPGATVFTAAPLRLASPTPGAQAGRHVPAAWVLAREPEVTTVLPVGTSLVVVQADAVEGDAGPADADRLGIRIEGATGGRRVVLTDGRRLTVTVRLRPGDSPVRVTVTRPDHLLLGGVVGGGGPTRAWTDRLRRRPDDVLVAVPAGGRVARVGFEAVGR